MLIITAVLGSRSRLSVAGLSRWGEVRHAFGGEARDFTREEGHVVVGPYRSIHDRIYADRADDATDADRADRTQDRIDPDRADHAPDADRAHGACDSTKATNADRAYGPCDRTETTNAVGTYRPHPDAAGTTGAPLIGVSH